MNCDCEDKDLSLLGRGNCSTVIVETRKLAFMHRYDSAGNKNFIDFKASGGGGGMVTVDDTFWYKLLREVDPSKRLYLTPFIENISEEINDEELEEMDSGRKFVTKDAFLSFEGFAVEKDASFELYREWKKNKCADLVFFFITSDGAIFGSSEKWEDLQLYPIPVSSGSYRVARIPGKAGEVTKIRIRFDWEDTFDDSQIVGVFDSAQVDTLINLAPITRVLGKIAAPATTTKITVSLRTNVIDNLQPDFITGLLITQFTLTEVGASPIVPSSMTEITSGVYELDGTFPTGEDVSVEVDIKGHVMRPIIIPIP